MNRGILRQDSAPHKGPGWVRSPRRSTQCACITGFEWLFWPYCKRIAFSFSHRFTLRSSGVFTVVRRPHILWASLAVYVAAILFAGRMHSHGPGECAGGLCSVDIAAATAHKTKDHGKSHRCCGHHHAEDSSANASQARRHIPPGTKASVLPPAEVAGSADGCLACQFLAMACAMVQPPQWQGSEPLVTPSVSIAHTTFVAPIARGFSSRAPPEAAVL